MTDPTPAAAFATTVAAHLSDVLHCPVCFEDVPIDGRCFTCGADLRGDAGTHVMAASATALAAFERRQQSIAEVPIHPVRGTHEVVALARPDARRQNRVLPALPYRPPVMPAGPVGAPSGLGVPAATSSSASLQSVLAVAGAGLFAVAAYVFTYFNPELTDRGVRTLVLSIVAVLFLSGAWFLAARKLQFSAEAVGALGIVFLALDISMIAGYAETTAAQWTIGAACALVGGAGMAALGVRRRIRSWVWISLIALAFVPVMLGVAWATDSTTFVGWVLTAAAASGLIAYTPKLAAAMGVGTPQTPRLRADAIALTVVQVLASIVAVASAQFSPFPDITHTTLAFTLAAAGIGLISLWSVGHPARTLWSLAAGITLSAAVFAGITGIEVPDGWRGIALGTAAAVALVLVAGVLPLPAATRTGFFRWAAGVVPAIVALSTVAVAATITLTTIVTPLPTYLPVRSLGVSVLEQVSEGVISLAIITVGAMIFTVLRRSQPVVAVPMQVVTTALATVTVITALSLPYRPVWIAIAVALAVTAVIGGALVLAARSGTKLAPVAWLRTLHPASRVTLIIGAHLALLVGSAVSWNQESWAAIAGLLVVAAIVLLSFTLPAGARFVHIGAAYGYALIVFALSLSLAGVGDVARMCLTSALGSVGAIAATYLRRIPERSWCAILVVTAAPFLIGVAQVWYERSGWTALSTGLMFLLALTLLLTRARRVHVSLRAIAAGLLVPTLSVMTVCLVAQLPASGSPIALPIIAIVVAIAFSIALRVSTAFAAWHGSDAQANAVRLALECSAHLTAVITVALALWRQAAGLPTAVLVLILLAVGGVGGAVWSRRRYAWWTATAAATGALWCVWALAGITAPEPYLLPTTLGIAFVALLLALRGRRAQALYGAGLGLAVVPLLVVLAVAGTPTTASAAWRGYGLLAAAWLLGGFGLLLSRSAIATVRALATPTLVIALVAGASGTIQAARFAWGADRVEIGSTPMIVLALGLGIAGALPAAIAGFRIRKLAQPGTRTATTRWLLAPALLILTAAVWPAMEQQWVTIWTMWVLLLAVLALLFGTALRLRRTAVTALPPIWFTFVIAFVTAVVGWSERELRVEWFSLPLGLFLLAAGAVFLQPRASAPDQAASITEPRRLAQWPAGWSGSWALLAPGLIVTVLASIISTFTDPMTWRAILVIVFALLMILWGARGKLAAPFVIGIVVLPVENLFAFFVQIGHGIESMPWWITLAIVGAVLLIIAVSYERRSSEDSSITARMRDLR